MNMETPMLNAHNKSEFEPAHTAEQAARRCFRDPPYREDRGSEIGSFRIISHSYADGVWRLRWKVVRIPYSM